MWNGRISWLVMSLLIWATACQLEISRDGGNEDAPRQDAGSPDAASPDAGSPDAGSPDAASPDAGSPDAGSPDAGSPDAGSPDAGLDIDCETILSETECFRTSGCYPATGWQYRDAGNGQVTHLGRKFAGCVKYTCGAIYVCAFDPNDSESCWWFPYTCIPRNWPVLDCRNALCPWP
jgi:hypothetical protein